MPCKDLEKQKGYSRKYYLANKAKVIANARARDVKTRETINLYLVDYLSKHPCVGCEEDDPIVLDFHHVRGKKLFSLGDSKVRRTSLKKVKAEIAKCDVLCCNCHRRATAVERGWFRATHAQK